MALETGLTHGWNFEGNSNDVVGSLTGTDTAMTYNNANGKILKGAGFASASPSRIDLSSTINDSVFSISGFVNLATLSGNAGVIEFAQSNAPYLRLNSSTSKIDLIAANVVGIASSTSTVTTGSWIQVGVTYDGSGNYVFYLNGASAGSGTSLHAFTFAVGNAKIGTELSNSENLNGSMDLLYTWNTIKTGAEFSTLWNGGAGMYYNGSIFVVPPNTAGGNFFSFFG